MTYASSRVMPVCTSASSTFEEKMKLGGCATGCAPSCRGVRLQAVQNPLHLPKHVIERREGGRQVRRAWCRRKHRACTKRLIVKRHLGVRLHHAGEAANAPGGDGVALGGIADEPSGLSERPSASITSDCWSRRTCMAIDSTVSPRRHASAHTTCAWRCGARALGRKRVRRKAQLSHTYCSTNGSMEEYVPTAPGDGARRGNLACLLETGLRALQSPCPAAELHAEGHRLGMDAAECGPRTACSGTRRRGACTSRQAVTSAKMMSIAWAIW